MHGYPEDMMFSTAEDTSGEIRPLRPDLERATPRMMVLYHGDLSRIGATTPPDLLQQQPIQLGRLEPDFIPFWTDQKPAPLLDRYISRHQATVRWVEASACFEVEPSPKAKMPLARVVWKEGQCTFLPLNRAALLPPGSLVAVGKRVLFLLDLLSWHSNADDRMGMVGETKAMWNLRKDINTLTRFEGTVLILGETGVGKELVARAIHAYGARAQNDFVEVNCAALPEHLAESLLFGHKKGAFTSAEQDSQGLFQEANGGSLFLDEVGELPMSIQAKLLRIIQDGRLVPVGGTRRDTPIDVRIIAATNRDPAQEIQAGALRKDLYFRIATHTITVPRLRDRLSDIPLIFMHALRAKRDAHPQLAWLWARPVARRPRLAMSFILRLLSHTWEGNIRELMNIVEQTARLNLHPGPLKLPPSLADQTLPSRPEDLLTLERMSDALLKKCAQKLGISRKTLSLLLRYQAPPLPDLSEEFDTFTERLREHLRATLAGLFAANNYTQLLLAEELGVSRATLIKLIRSFELRRPQDLSLEELQQAYRTANGDLQLMAHQLHLSPRALKLYITRNNLKEHL